MNIKDGRYDFQSEKIFSALPEKDKAEIFENFEPISYKKGTLIFKQGRSATGVFFIEKGKAKIFKTGLNAKEQIFYIYGAGELFGYHALIANEKYADSCEALTDCELLFLNKDRFKFLLEKISGLKDLFITNMSHEFGVLVGIITILSQVPVRERSAFFLLLLQKRFESEDNREGLIILKRDDFANIVGTSRESLSRILKSFKEDGYIAFEGKAIKIVDFSRLEKLATLY